MRLGGDEFRIFRSAGSVAVVLEVMGAATVVEVVEAVSLVEVVVMEVVRLSA